MTDNPARADAGDTAEPETVTVDLDLLGQLTVRQVHTMTDIKTVGEIL